MILNIYEFVKANPGQFRQFCFKDILFVLIDCPPDFVKGEEWAQHNSFIHVLAGKKHLFTRESKTWDIEAGTSVCSIAP